MGANFGLAAPEVHDPQRSGIYGRLVPERCYGQQEKWDENAVLFAKRVRAESHDAGLVQAILEQASQDSQPVAHAGPKASLVGFRARMRGRAVGRETVIEEGVSEAGVLQLLLSLPAR